MTSIAQTIKRQLVRRLMNNKLAIMCEEPIVCDFR